MTHNSIKQWLKSCIGACTEMVHLWRKYCGSFLDIKTFHEEFMSPLWDIIFPEFLSKMKFGYKISLILVATINNEQYMMQNPEAINNAGKMSNIILVLIENRINGRSRSYACLTVLSA